MHPPPPPARRRRRRTVFPLGIQLADVPMSGAQAHFHRRHALAHAAISSVLAPPLAPPLHNGSADRTRPRVGLRRASGRLVDPTERGAARAFPQPRPAGVPPDRDLVVTGGIWSTCGRASIRQGPKNRIDSSGIDTRRWLLLSEGRQLRNTFGVDIAAANCLN